MKNQMREDENAVELLKKRLLEIEEEQEKGAKNYTLDELDCALRAILNGNRNCII